VKVVATGFENSISSSRTSFDAISNKPAAGPETENSRQENARQLPAGRFSPP